MTTKRRDFLLKMGLGAGAFTLAPDEMRASGSETAGPWDTSWLDRLAAAQYRVVFNASEMNDGEVLGYASTFLDHYHEVHGTTDSQTRPVVVFRRLGTALALNDAMWDRYELGADTKTQDASTRAPARRNVYWRGNGTSADGASTIDSLHKRGMISLVCNVALGNMGRRLAQKTQRNPDEVQAELRSSLVPGAIIVPSGIYALIRAQNAGCAFMPGT